MAAFWFGAVCFVVGVLVGLAGGAALTAYVIKRKKLPPTEGGG